MHKESHTSTNESAHILGLGQERFWVCCKAQKVIPVINNDGEETIELKSTREFMQVKHVIEPGENVSPTEAMLPHLYREGKSLRAKAGYSSPVSPGKENHHHGAGSPLKGAESQFKSNKLTSMISAAGEDPGDSSPKSGVYVAHMDMHAMAMHELHAVGKSIVDRYILEGSPLQVNIPGMWGETKSYYQISSRLL
jgi:hypothetical protein